METPNNSIDEGVFNKNTFPYFFKENIFLICALLSLLIIIFCFIMIFVFGLNCDTGNYTSPLITMIISNWLTHGMKYIFNGNVANSPHSRNSVN